LKRAIDSRSAGKAQPVGDTVGRSSRFYTVVSEKRPSEFGHFSLSVPVARRANPTQLVASVSGRVVFPKRTRTSFRTSWTRALLSPGFRPRWNLALLDLGPAFGRDVLPRVCKSSCLYLLLTLVLIFASFFLRGPCASQSRSLFDRNDFSDFTSVSSSALRKWPAAV
jgi:hypothetical protein